MSAAETHDLGPVELIPEGEGRAFDVGGARIAVFRTRGGKLFATQASCPHKEGPLADGLVGEGCVVCPLHGYEYDLESGAAVGHDCGALRTYPVSIDEGGRVLLRVG
jgi:nitrite reductase (NADH) small subunit